MFDSGGRRASEFGWTTAAKRGLEIDEASESAAWAETFAERLSHHADRNPEIRSAAGVTHFVDQPGRTPRFALFDLDDTLIDLSGAYARWAAEFAERHRLNADSISWLNAAPRVFPGPKNRLLARAKDRFGLADSVDELWTQYRRRIPELARTRSGVLDGLALLRREGWAVGIVTNGALDNQLGKIRRTGLAEHVDGYVISGEVGVRKPDPRIFGLAAQHAGAETAEGGWIVGDDPILDIRGGLAAGMSTCWVTHGREWPGGDPEPDVSAQDTCDAIDALLALTRVQE
ncbi:HAD family hydrolase [Nocardia sp. NPDC003693]